MSLYKSASGREVDHASSSSIDNFRLCRRKFKLSRIDGWRQKAKKASLEFGKCVESAIQYYHDNGLKPGDGPEEFRRLWAKWIENTELVYTAQEGSWLELNTMGKEMLRLYEILLPTLPIKNPKFQLQFLKELWPGDPTYGGLKFMAYVDMLSTLDDGSRLIIDIKTAKSMLPVTAGMMSLDGQLRKYAWVSGFRNVAFLNLVKAEPEGYKKGSRVSLLEDVGDFKAGSQVTVAKFQAPKDAVPASEGVKGSSAVEWLMLVSTPEVVQKMDEGLDAISGKGASERKEALLRGMRDSGMLTSVTREQITKTRLQFVQGTIPEKDLAEIGDQIGIDIRIMKMSHDENIYSRDGGVRFPNQTCTWCEFNPLCLGDPKKREETLYQIRGVSEEDPKEEDWLTELEGDEE